VTTLADCGSLLVKGAKTASLGHFKEVLYFCFNFDRKLALAFNIVVLGQQRELRFDLTDFCLTEEGEAALGVLDLSLEQVIAHLRDRAWRHLLTEVVAHF